MKERIAFLQKRMRIALQDLGENISSLEYSKERCDKLIDESQMLKEWIRELKGFPKDKV